MMHMTFYWGKTVTILFDSWKTDSWTSYTLSLFALFLVSLFYQYFEDRRLSFKRFAVGRKSESAIETPFLIGGDGRKWRKVARVGTGVLFGVNSAIGYLLMLSVMSFNGGVFVVVVLGLSVGYLLFRIDDNEGEVVVVVDDENTCVCA
ncbi:hypothetical protein GIB67_008900 [Kingdonia uniflora]|uniref:Copper transport protein n=1 Tax=Kingdonia uniflora TaxID=39325 RepID=A0A7J7LVL7_9MAGN|nr:hypothetical protein GIB67_008900 [Kingdonia uniflora]